MFVTSSFTVAQRLGTSTIEELSRKNLDDKHRKTLIDNLKNEEKKMLENGNDNPLDFAMDTEKKDKTKISLRGLKTNINFFEHSFSKSDKGNYKVWSAFVRPLPTVNIPIYLHAVNDSKPVYRITNRHAALPPVKMKMTVLNPTSRKKELVEKETSSAHKCFRYNMGFNDGSDRMRSVIGLSGRYYKSWPKHLVAKTLEDCIINSYCNFLLDPNCKGESFTS